jgi:hypothetical protein
MLDSTSIRSLIDELSELRAEMLREERAIAERLTEICEAHRESARNLAHYIALRRRDIRDVQEKLTANGLSSLGRAEADVLGAVDAVLRVLHRLAGDTNGASFDGGSHPRGWRLLKRNTDDLLGTVLLPITIGIYLVHEDGAVFTAVTSQSALAIAVNVEPPYHTAVLERPLPHSRVYDLSLLGNITRQTHVKEQQPGFDFHLCSDARL